MSGYDPNFLGIHLPLPTAKPSRVADVLQAPALTGGQLAEYPNYALTTDRRRRSPMFVVALIDQAAQQPTTRSDDWRIDQRVGADFQLDNAYYVHNDWDRGHMAMRSAASWGATRMAAQRAADETFYYSNACLQHANLNQDEWLALEEWVLALNVAKDGKVVVFAGPLYDTQVVTTLEPSGRPRADVPAGFFKVVCFVDKATGELGVRAFHMLQDPNMMKDKNGRKTFASQNYQATVKEIEELSGLEFADAVYEKNPLFFADGPAATAAGVTSFPERIDINSPGDIVNHPTDPRVDVADDDVEVYITSAMVAPPPGKDEWVALMNLEAEAVDLSGWRLVDKGGRAVQLSGRIGAGESKVLTTRRGLGGLKLGNQGGLLVLFNAKEQRIDRADYTAKEVQRARRSGKALPVNFLTYRHW